MAELSPNGRLLVHVDEGHEMLQSAPNNGPPSSTAPLREDRGSNPVQPANQSNLKPCGCGDKNGRRLVVCIDGTSNQFGTKNTNVIELYRLIKKGENDNQLTYYNSGIGTYAQPSSKTLSYYKRTFGHKIDLAIAWNFERIIIDAYRWLSENYKKDDSIFLFGFSRGAYQVRTLSAMIDKVGLIHRGNEAQIPFAYQLYADPESDAVSDVSSPEDLEASIPRESSARTFKITFSREVKVHFIGAWDTVSSIGVVRARKLLPGTVNGMTHVCFFRHALALDERRVKFLPEYANGGAGPSKPVKTPNVFHDTKEVWFAGTHSDVGGGAEENKSLNRTRPSLRWMFSEASAAGLHLDPFNREFNDEEAINIHESLTLLWRPFERLPFRRLMYSEERDAGLWKDSRWIPLELLAWLMWMIVEVIFFFLWVFWKLLVVDWHALRLTTSTHMGNRQERTEGGKAMVTISWPPHRGKGRVIQPGQKIHTSVWRSQNLDTADAPDITDATGLPKLSTTIRATMSRLFTRRQTMSKYTPRAYLPSEPEFWRNLRQPKGSGLKDDAWKTWKEVDLYDSVDDLVQQYSRRELAEEGDDERRTQLAMIQIHAQSSLIGRQALLFALANRLEEPRPIEVNIFCDIVKVLMTASDPRQLQSYADMGAYLLRYLDDDGAAHNHSHGKRLFARDIANSLKSIEDTVEWYTNQECVTDDDTQRAQLMTMRIYASSADGRHELIGALVKRLKKDRVVYPDILRRVLEILVERSDSGSQVKLDMPYWTIRSQMSRHLIDAGATQCQVALEVLKRCAEVTRTVQVLPVTGLPVPFLAPVDCVSLSSDGKRIVACSRDRMIRIWDAETGQAVGMPLEAFSAPVLSVAFFPDCKHFVSGSIDGTIRIWNAETGQAVTKPLKGHTGSITSVAISPDNRRIISGSGDKTIRIWNADDGQEVGKPLEGHTEIITSGLAFSPRGERIISGSVDKTIRIWNSETGEAVGSPLEAHDPVFFVAFSPDETRIASGMSDGAIRFWDTETRQAVGQPLEAHAGGVYSAAFSQDGKHIVSCSADKKIRIWDAKTGQAVGRPYEGHRALVRTAAFFPNGMRIVSGSEDGTVRIWDLLHEPM